jgi:hypothetical protein
MRFVGCLTGFAYRDEESCRCLVRFRAPLQVMRTICDASDITFERNRNNYPFGAGTGNSKLINGTYWYPGDEWKDVARMVMYMCGTLWQSMPSTLLQ